MKEIIDVIFKTLIIIFLVIILILVVNNRKVQELQDLEIDNLSLRVEKLEFLVELRIINEEEIYSEIDEINKDLNYFYGVGEPSKKSIPGD